MRNNLLWRAVAELFKKFYATQQGVYEKDGETVSYERTEIIAGKFRITIIAEEIVENLQELIDRAIENENYELADELTKKLNNLRKKKDDL